VAGLGLCAVVLAAVIAAYVYVVSAGYWSPWPSWSYYDDTQAEGFRSGHLYTTVAPSPIMRTLMQPLDQRNMPYWKWDYSYYADRLYLYWGLAPAAFLAGAKAVLHITAQVGDHMLVFAFLVGRALFGLLLIRAMARRFAPAPPAWAVWVAFLVFALAHPTPWLLARGSVYEGAIAGGAFFMVAGLACAFRAIFSDRPRAAAWWLAPASLAFGLGAACRISLLPVAAALVGVALAARWHADRRRDLGAAHVLRLAAAAGIPFAAITFAQMVTNKLRYQAWTDFGHHYQMGKEWSMGPRFILANLWSYSVRTADLTCHFPFLVSLWHEKDHVPLHDHIPAWIPARDVYQAGEPTAGVLVVIPFVLLGLCLLRQPPGGISNRWRWFLGALGVATLGGLAPLLTASASSMRYEGDFASGLLLVAALGGWRLLRAPAGRAARAAAAALYGALALATIAAGMAFGYTSYFDHFARHNPTALMLLQHRFDVCKSIESHRRP
jgi:hypothetical protein